ncbi:MAG: glycoside hydrolase family 57 protein [Phycisphaeraceae bacterium]|nr:glycoside hydrolase family 57 protein [Phycisphaeraceae bacterium]
MTSICLYFQIHQPYRLRRYSLFDNGPDYLDHDRNRAILERVLNKCYLPSTSLLLDLVKQHEGRFRFAFSMTGTLVEQWRDHCPKMLELMKRLVGTGCVELLAETYHHSLASVYSPDEFIHDVKLHGEMMKEHFDYEPTFFRNTELIYSDRIAEQVAAMGRYRGMLSEAPDRILGERSPNIVAHAAGLPDFKILLKNYRLSDDIAFRFSNRGWEHWPMTAEKFAQWLDVIGREGKPGGRDSTRDRAMRPGPVCGLFMDYETFGEHQWQETGILNFLRALPGAILATGVNDFLTPTEICDRIPASWAFRSPQVISWADTERDLSAWAGNAMQSSALHDLYKQEEAIKAAADEALLSDWRRLQTSDHFYYMCTKYFGDGMVHKYFNPYESPYDSYINYVNVLDHLRTRIEASRPSPSR